MKGKLFAGRLFQFLFLLSVFAAPMRLWAQETATLTGRVVDAQGAGVNGAQVIAFQSLTHFAALGTKSGAAFANTNANGEYAITGLAPGRTWTLVPLYDANGNGQDDDGRFFAPNYREVRVASGEQSRAVPTFVLDERVETGNLSLTFSVPVTAAVGGPNIYASLPQAFGGVTELLDNRRLVPLGVWIVLVRLEGDSEFYYNWMEKKWDYLIGEVGPNYFLRAAHIASTWAAHLPALDPGSYRAIAVGSTNARRFSNLSASFTTGVETTRTWTGAGTDNEWINDANWEPQGRPTTSDHVIINGGGPQPQITNPFGKSISRLTIQNGGSLRVLSTFNVAGDINVTLNGTAGEGLKVLGEVSGGALRFGNLFAGGNVTFTSTGGTSQGNFTNGNIYVGGNFTAEGNNAFAGSDGSVGTWLIQRGTEPKTVSMNPSAPDNNRLFMTNFNNTAGTVLLTDLYAPKTTPSASFDFIVSRNALLKSLAARSIKLAGNMENSGRVSPGQSPGTLAIEGNYTQRTTGALEIEIGGAPGSGQSDTLNVTGAAALGGTLDVLPINGYTPAAADTYPFLSYASVTGAFDSVVGAPSVQFGATGAFVSPGGGGGFPLGDVDGNATVDVGDAVVVLKSVVGSEKLTAEQIMRADVDKNNSVDVGDAVQILRKVVGLPVGF